MKFTSTRSSSVSDSFESALLNGYAPDGGLYIPEDFPTISTDDLKTWKSLSFQDICFEVLKLYVSEDEMPHSELRKVIAKSFSSFEAKEIIPVVPVHSGISVSELFHGPTLAFKDVALQLVANFLQYFLKKRNQRLTVLVGTSGDTGSAAACAVRDAKNIDYFCLFPTGGRISRVQELQLKTITGDRVHMVGVDGTSDDLDIPIRNLFRDQEFKDKTRLCSINSINMCRIVSQVAHYFWSYLRVCNEECSDTVQFCIPSGALGNITSGMVAQIMGLPVKLVGATNVNDVFVRFVESGTFKIADSVQATLAPAMDIQMPYNIERILYMLCKDSVLVKEWMEGLESGSKDTVLTPEYHAKLKERVSAQSVSEAVFLECIGSVQKDHGYLLDPHTAVGYVAAQSLEGKRVILATAHPNKSEEAIEKATGSKPSPDSRIERLESAKKTFIEFDGAVETWEGQLRELIETSVNAPQKKCSVM